MDGGAFLDRVAAYARDGWRLVLINTTAVLPGEATPDGAFDVSWSFARGAELEHLAERVLPGEAVPSISGSFPGAFLYENEMRELFGVEVTGIDVDLQGQLYRTATRVPFSPSAIRARLEATGRLERSGGHGPGTGHPKPEATA
ncbi:MAG TPA: NADH-quinone oxidoreductase subunit C [Candidatus Limnocylindrales bacterium]